MKCFLLLIQTCKYLYVKVGCIILFFSQVAILLRNTEDQTQFLAFLRFVLQTERIKLDSDKKRSTTKRKLYFPRLFL